MAFTRVMLTLPAEPDFVGRADELKALTAAGSTGSADAIIVAGPLGVGRSRLIRHWLDKQPGRRGLWAVAEQPSSSPGSMFADLLLSWIEALPGAGSREEKLSAALHELIAAHGDSAPAADLKRGAPFLMRAIGVDPADRLEHWLTKLGYLGELTAGLRALLAALTAEARANNARLVLILDDIDAADLDSVNLFNRALYNLRENAPLLICTTADARKAQDLIRPSGLGIRTIEVQPFGKDEQIQFTGRMLEGCVLPEKLNDSLWERSGGLPLALELQIRLLVTQHVLVAKEEGGWEVAEAVENAGSSKELLPLLTDVIESLPDETRRVVAAAGAIGHRFTKRVLAAVVKEMGGDETSVDRHVLRLIKQGFMCKMTNAEGDWVFRHPAFRRACDDIGDEAAQKALHKAAAAALSSFGATTPERLARLVMYHAIRAGDYETAVRHAALAATEALRRGLLHGVTRIGELILPHLRKVEAIDDVADARARLLMAVARAHIKLANPGQAAEVMALLPNRDLLSDEIRHALLCELADIYAATGEFSEVVGQLEEAMARAKPSSVEYGDLAFSRGLILRREGKWESAREHMANAREAFTANNKPDRAVNCLHQAAAIYRLENMLDQAEMLLDEALELVKASHDRADLGGTLMTLTAVRYHRGDMPAAEEALRQAYEILVSVGDLDRLEACRSNLASIYFQQNKLEEAKQTFQETLESARSRHNTTAAIYSLVNLAVISVAEGEHEQAIGRLLEARAEAEDTGVATVLPYCNLHLIRAYIETGRLQEARDLIEPTRKQCREQSKLDFEAETWALEGTLFGKEGASAAKDRPVDGPETPAYAGKAIQCFEKALSDFAEFEALGRVSESMNRGDLSLGYARFLIEHAGELGDLVPEGAAKRAKALLETSQVEFQRQIDGGTRFHERHLKEAQELAAKL